MTNDPSQTPPNETPTQETLPLPNEEVKLSKAEFDKITQQLAAFKKQASEADAKIKAREIEEAKKVQDWQKVAELKEKEASDALEKLSTFKNAFLMDKKLTAVREAAISAGAIKEALNDLDKIDDLSDVVLTENNGKIQVNGVERAIQRLKATRSYMFNKPLPSLNSTTPAVTSPTGSAVTLDQIKKAEKQFQATGKGAEELKALYAQWSEQKRRA